MWWKLECRCGATIKLTGKDRKQLEAWLDLDGWNCPGFHVEIGTRRSYLKVVEEHQGDLHVPTTRELVDEFLKTHPREDIFLLGNPKVAEELGIGNLHAVPGLEHIGFGDFRGEGHEYRRMKDTPDGRIMLRVKG